MEENVEQLKKQIEDEDRKETEKWLAAQQYWQNNKNSIGKISDSHQQMQKHYQQVNDNDGVDSYQHII